VVGIDDDGFVALVSALNRTLPYKFDLSGTNSFGELYGVGRESSEHKGLQQVKLPAASEFSINPAVVAGGLSKNTSLVEVEIERSHGEWSQKLKFLGQRNRFYSSTESL
jgi:hypothetical protein